MLLNLFGLNKKITKRLESNGLIIFFDIRTEIDLRKNSKIFSLFRIMVKKEIYLLNEIKTYYYDYENYELNIKVN